ncbi:MAG: hypothetical protein MSG64_10885 [Pyrinomonadaceae bacterium MAG19_C2-C3]|nr:hypothetical protein [Pyrinomonadaceae bacterium MAG19_C2-C3]
MSGNLHNKVSDEEYLAALKAEEELQAKYKDHPSKLIRLMMAARMENLRLDGRLKTEEELNAEIRESKGASAWDEDD